MKSLADYEQKFDRLHEDCPVRAALDVIRGRWKPSIFYELKDGPRRFSQLQAALAGITAQALTVQLRQLEADAVVVRTVHADESPLRVEYALSESGKTLSSVLDQLEVWGAAYMARRGTTRSRVA
ncbi:helix-turn-helix domain-containing protein [Nannocystis sp. ILAH1]|uniref:winged helix-turn-helix transcriptional regulator n=1 Tax=unclassified Nannocystis TaxID=2627009 RepID=UPI00226D771E|nr:MULTISPECIES: helix-turn-helix domain-containing protein [unclassified Nannocystis]MCY0993469.1 helix-turn-helix domain-containing protein [Nannocystis sp. ILAH1]MCY1063803.1 helix-turn-helix domain-containing protein [Nannocystis sp. RBIL2]